MSYEQIAIIQLQRARSSSLSASLARCVGRASEMKRYMQTANAHSELALRALRGMNGARPTCALGNLAACEFKFIDRNRFSAYASTFRTADDARGDCIDDRILRGAFADDLKENGDERPLFFEHDPDQRIGIARGIREDARGLKFFGILDDSALAMDIRDALEARVLSEMSIGFKVLDCESKSARIVKRIALYEISVVTAACDWRATTI